MVTGFDESTTFEPNSSSNNGGIENHDNDAGDFECNICFDLANDPIVTLCGHLFCKIKFSSNFKR
ncbi:hypothetical protein RND81_14G217500 [Saponaria officinalis]|uniref:E3 ubiquitin-protein ligase RMA n=1 Tax=Saponaria officinalis TaxID=3572 RepID=A0AAW1GQ35_SAPOF